MFVLQPFHLVKMSVIEILKCDRVLMTGTKGSCVTPAGDVRAPGTPVARRESAYVHPYPLRPPSRLAISQLFTPRSPAQMQVSANPTADVTRRAAHKSWRHEVITSPGKTAVECREWAELTLFTSLGQRPIRFDRKSGHLSEGSGSLVVE